MKVLGISMGRRMGNSEILLKQALKACEEEGLEVAFIRLHDYKINPCTGCELCTKLNRAQAADPEHLNPQTHCMYPWDSDDYRQLIDLCEGSDGLIFAAPAYHLMPPGIGTVMLNRNHCAGLAGKYWPVPESEHRVCATIGVGGSDWTSLFLPILDFTATEMIGSKMRLVDHMKLHRTPAIGMVLCNQEALDRAKLLGKRVAASLMEGTTYFRGGAEDDGYCPVCHNSIMVVRHGRFACAICDYEGDPVIVDSKIDHINWDGGIEITRWSPAGVQHHDDEQFNVVKFIPGKGYVFTEEQKTAMEEGRKVWGKYLDPVMPKR